METEYIDMDSKYRIKYVYALEDDYEKFYLQKRFLFIFWRTVSEADTLSSIHEAYEITLYLNEKD